jgi:hypothetical protein
MISRLGRLWPLFVASILAVLAAPAFGQGADGRPAASERPARLVLPTPSAEELRRADEERAIRGEVPHFAVARKVDADPWKSGRWDILEGGRIRWSLRVASPGATSLSFAFTRFHLPEGAEMWIESNKRLRPLGPFDSRDNETHGQLWTPPFLGDEARIEVELPFEHLDELQLRLTRVHHGYAGFGEPEPKSGDCNRDVVCSEGSAWSEVARSVGLISVEGVRFCTAFLVNNTALDGRPLLLTAAHCGVTSENAPSVAVMWNHESSLCRDGAERHKRHGGEVVDHLRHFQSGAILRAKVESADLTLLELDDRPDPAVDAYYAGWDLSGDPLRRAVTIHHPNTDAKRISFDFDTAVATTYLSEEPRADGDHWRIAGWDLGTTEGGSSGAPLFDRDRRVVGILHGGYAACGNQKADWFSRLASAVEGSALGRWLDPVGSDVRVLDGADAGSLDESGIEVADLESSESAGANPSTFALEPTRR